MKFFAVFLQKLEPSCEIGACYAAIFKKVLYRKWPPLALFLSQYHALFADITFVRYNTVVRHCLRSVYSH